LIASASNAKGSDRRTCAFVEPVIDPTSAQR
jgi:hypothetical protein